jgi:hypothetical protein
MEEKISAVTERNFKSQQEVNAERRLREQAEAEVSRLKDQLIAELQQMLKQNRS